MSIIINGIPSDIDNSINWETDPTIKVKPPIGARKRTETPDLIVVHWTGGESGARRAIMSMRRRRLAAHFVIDRDENATIYQTCDPVKYICSHAGKFNSRSIGIEVVCYGHKTDITPGNLNDSERERKRYEAKIDGKKFTFADFREAQYASLISLVDELCYALLIPCRVPRNINGEILHERMTEKQSDRFSGVCGHYHLSRNKIDPGPRVIDAIGDYYGC